MPHHLGGGLIDSAGGTAKISPCQTELPKYR